MIVPVSSVRLGFAAPLAWVGGIKANDTYPADFARYEIGSKCMASTAMKSNGSGTQ